MLKIAFGKEKNEFWKIVRLPFWIVIVLRLVIALFGYLGLANYFFKCEWNWLQYAVWLQLGIFAVVIAIAHNITKNQDLRQQFALLGWTCIIAGFTGIMVLLLTLAVFSMIFIVDLIIDIFKN